VQFIIFSETLQASNLKAKRFSVKLKVFEG